MKNRMRLADCSLGFGRHTTGGKGGKIYVVTDSSDNDMVNPKPGTLRHAVIQPGPLWIIFKQHMVIRLSEELIMTSHKTIDGRGAQVHIAYGAGFTVQFVQNVIIHNLVFMILRPETVEQLEVRWSTTDFDQRVMGMVYPYLDHQIFG